MAASNLTSAISAPETKVARTVLKRSGLEISRVALGFAHAHTFPQADREALIRRALDLGITHFDTSRFYSDGLSEEVLGRALKANRSAVTIGTKFGLIPTPVIASAGAAAPILRKARGLLSKLKVMPYPKRSYTRGTMQKSLHDSLRALQTDYIDIYMLHGPLARWRPKDDLFTELEKEKKKGTVRFIGVSGNEIDGVVAEFGSVLDVIQIEESLWSENRFVPDLTFSLFSGAEKQKGSPLKDEEIRQLLERALARRRNGSVIVQTRRPANLAKIVALASGI